MEELLKKISEMIVDGEDEEIADAVQEALDAGVSADDILNNGLLAGMNEVGEQFAEGDMFIPEVLMASETMTAGVEVLRPFLSSDDQSSKGKILLATVEGDLHDIGKKLVAMMLGGQGYDVVDLGVDIENDEVVKRVEEENPDILGLSAMLTTTMDNMKVIKEKLDADGFDNVKMMVGGAPVTEDFASGFGANYSSDAPGASKLAKELIG